MIKRILLSLLLGFMIIAVAVSFAMIISNDTTEPIVDARLEAAVNQWRYDMYRAHIDCAAAYNRIDIIRVRAGDGLHAGGSDIVRGEVSVTLTQLEAGEYSTMGTIYHELGHQVFHLSHNSCTLMRPQTWTEEEYREHWEEWVNEYLQECIKHEFDSKY